METTLEAMEKRLRSAERRSRAALVLGIAGLTAGLFLASERPGIGQDQAPGVLRAPLDVRNAGGRTIFYVGEDKDGPLIRLNDATGKQVAMIWSDMAGGNLILKGAGGKNTVSAVSRDDGAGGEVAVGNREGVTVASLFSRADGTGGNVRVNDQSGGSVFAAFARGDGAGGNMTVYNRDHKVAVAALSRPDGAGGDLGVYHDNGETGAAMFVQNGGGHILMKDRSGKVLHTLP